MKLRIGHLSTFYHTAIILMSDKDTPGKLGSDVEWRLFGTGPEIIKAIGDKELDLAYVGLPPAIIGIDRGLAIKCVAGGHIEGTVLCGKNRYAGYPEIDDLTEILEQFRGLGIGVPGNGSIHDVILKDRLEKSGLEKEIKVINFKWADRIIEAVVKDEVAAAIGTPALAVAIKKFAAGKILYPPSRLWPNNPSYGIVVSKGLFDNGKDIIEKFLILHENASSLLRNNPAGAAKIIAAYVGFVDERFVIDTLMISPKYCAQITKEYISATMEFAGALKRLGYTKEEVSAEEIFDTSLIGKTHPLKDHYDENVLSGIRAQGGQYV